MIVACPACRAQNRLPAARLHDKAKCAACKERLLPLASPVAITSPEDFDELVRDAPSPVLVDFWAEWCGPCRSVAPELEKLAKSRAGGLVVAKVDTDAVPRIAERFGIRSIPTFIAFRGGRESARVSGAMPASAIVDRLGV
jgi:thioredoxin 2